MGITGSQPSSCIPCGGNVGCLGVNENDEVRLSRGMDCGIRETRKNLANTPKILLLGAGESGKSTIVKQMRLLNNVPFTEYERELYRVHIFYNLVYGMRSLLEAMRELPPLEELSSTDDSSSAYPPPNPSDSNSPNPLYFVGPVLRPLPSAAGPSSAGTSNIATPGPSFSSAIPQPSNANQGGGAVKRPRPAFLVHPPMADEDDEDKGDGDGGEEGVQVFKHLDSPGSVGRRELDGASTLNTNPNRSHDAHSHSNSSPRTPPASLLPLSSFTDNNQNHMSPSSLLYSSSSNPGRSVERFTTSSPEPIGDPDTSNRNLNPKPDSDSDPDTFTSNPNPNTDANKNSCIDQPSPNPRSRSPTRSSSLSLNIFNLGALTPRQHAALLNKLRDVPDIRPGEPFPMEYEVLLRELWWGWEDRVDAGVNMGGNIGGVGRRGVRGDGVEGMSREPGVGHHLDRIQSETGIALPDNLTYFFASPQKLTEWFSDDYVPSDEDVLRCRGRTTGVQETIFTLEKSALGRDIKERRKVARTRRDGGDEMRTGPGTATTASGTTATTSGSGEGYSHGHGNRHGSHVPWLDEILRLSIGKTRLRLVDVGGQRSERRRWINCFQDVTAVLFLAGLSGYSQGMLEDPSSNQMTDAVMLWDGVCSSPWFKQTSLILFLNKKDLFAEKIAKFPIKNYFPDYDGGGTDVAVGLDYFKQKFLRVYAKSTAREITHDSTTTAADNYQGKGEEKENEKGKCTEKELDKGKGRGKEPERGKEKESEKETRKEKETERGRRKDHVALVQRRAVFAHFTTATDTKQLRLTMVAVCDTILQDNLAAAHFL